LETSAFVVNGFYGGIAELRAVEANSPNWVDWMFSLLAPRTIGQVLEVGCGAGTYTWRFKRLDSVISIVATDLDSECLMITRDRCGVPVYDFNVAVSCDCVEIRKLHGTFDTIVCFNVIEHIEDDYRAVCNMAGLLARPGGRLLILAPVGPWLFGSFDQRIGHYRRYKRADFEQIIRRAGLRIVSSRYIHPVGLLGWWMINQKSDRCLQGGVLARMHDRLVVPVCRTIESVVPMPYGFSILIEAALNW
jgi:SAM-dependent methyltransferase